MQSALWGGGANSQPVPTSLMSRATANTGVALTEALEALRSLGARPMWLPAAWGAWQAPRLPPGVVVRARVIDFLERGYFINEAARWLRELGAEVTHAVGGNRPLQGLNGCGIAAGGACGVLAAAGPQWSAIRDADVSFATDGGFVQRINTELGFEPARLLDETDVGRVLDTVRPSATGGAAYAGYSEWCSVVPVDLLCHVLVNDIESVGAGGGRKLKITAVANQLSNGECVLGHPHWIAVAYEVSLESRVAANGASADGTRGASRAVSSNGRPVRESREPARLEQRDWRAAAARRAADSASPGAARAGAPKGAVKIAPPASFVSSKTWTGAVSGKVFKQGEHGLGYYQDAPEINSAGSNVAQRTHGGEQMAPKAVSKGAVATSLCPCRQGCDCARCVPRHADARRVRFAEEAARPPPPLPRHRITVAGGNVNKSDAGEKTIAFVIRQLGGANKMRKPRDILKEGLLKALSALGVDDGVFDDYDALLALLRERLAASQAAAITAAATAAATGATKATGTVAVVTAVQEDATRKAQGGAGSAAVDKGERSRDCRKVSACRAMTRYRESTMSALSSRWWQPRRRTTLTRAPSTSSSLHHRRPYRLHRHRHRHFLLLRHRHHLHLLLLHLHHLLRLRHLHLHRLPCSHHLRCSLRQRRHRRRRHGHRHHHRFYQLRTPRR